MIYKNLIRPILFQCNPEFIHEVAVSSLPLVGQLYKRNKINDHEKLAVTCAGINFPNRIGLAAGVDKEGHAISSWGNFGFGFIEIGTVTRHPQPGNPRPRLFRLKQQESILNRMGFNNAGVESIIARLKNSKHKIPLGINLGKSKIIDSENFDSVLEDYAQSILLIQEFADYLAINVSSPNTPNLRQWERPENLSYLLSNLRKFTKKPLFVKISPDLDEKNMSDIMEICLTNNIDGMIATNTTISRDDCPDWTKNELGGISGKLLSARSLQCTRFLGKIKPKNFTLISVGGISSPKDALIRLEAGADLIQIYSALIYEGPELISKINKSLIL